MIFIVVEISFSFALYIFYNSIYSIPINDFCVTLLEVILWIGISLLPLDSSKKHSNHSPLQFFTSEISHHLE